MSSSDPIVILNLFQDLPPPLQRTHHTKQPCNSATIPSRRAHLAGNTPPPKENMPLASPLQTLANSIATLLKERGETVAVAESSTGGLVSAALLAVPGASAYFMGGSVVYTKTARDEFLGIDFDNHPGMRSASEPYAALLAKTSRELLKTTWGISETGASGPTGNPYGDAPGHTCVAVVGPTTEAASTLETALTDRETNMQLFAEHCLQNFEDILLKA
jgi:nicotinamide-nucleotide amidase